MCFQPNQCYLRCLRGQNLDPRELCKCVDQSVIDGLYTCVPKERAIYSDRGLNLSQVEVAKPRCSLTVNDCQNSNFRVNKDTCECECDIFCIATMSIDPDKCECVPIDFNMPKLRPSVNRDPHGPSYHNGMPYSTGSSSSGQTSYDGPSYGITLSPLGSSSSGSPYQEQSSQ